MQKENAIIAALDYLRHRLGDHSFEINDHWAADRMAVGIACPIDPGRLVYIACSNQTSATYTAILEFSLPPGSDPPYEECGHFADLDLDGLAAIVSAHLQT